MSRKSGVSDRQLLELSRYRESDAFDEVERLVIEYAERMCTQPVHVPAELFTALRSHFDEAQIVELTGAIAWENYRARFNRALEIGPDGFSEGAVCVLPEHAG